MIYTEKIRIYPNQAQKILIDKRLVLATKLWDRLIDYTRKSLEFSGFVPKYINMCNYLTDCLKEINLSTTIRQGVAKRIETAYTLFFEERKRGNKKVRPPKMKNGRVTKSFTYQNNTSKKLFLDENHLWLDRELGSMKCSYSRSIDGKPKTVTIKKTKSGEYYAYVSVDGYPSNAKLVSLNRRKQVGIDPGLMRFATLSDGTCFSPCFDSRRLRKRIRRAQVTLSRRTKGSLGYKKQRRKLAKLHQRMVNKRNDFQWKLAFWLVQNYEVICLEETELKDLQQENKKQRRKRKKNRKLIDLFPKMIDMAHYLFREKLMYMSNKYGSEVLLVDPMYTSQECSGCGCLVPKKLKERVHYCPRCGLEVDRDLNAAQNILRRGLMKMYKGTVGTTGTVERFVRLFVSQLNLDSTTLVNSNVTGSLT